MPLLPNFMDLVTWSRYKSPTAKMAKSIKTVVERIKPKKEVVTPVKYRWPVAPEVSKTPVATATQEASENANIEKMYKADWMASAMNRIADHIRNAGWPEAYLKLIETKESEGTALEDKWAADTFLRLKDLFL